MLWCTTSEIKSAVCTTLWQKVQHCVILNGYCMRLTSLDPTNWPQTVTYCFGPLCGTAIAHQLFTVKGKYILRSIVTESCHCQNTKYNSCFLAVWLPTYVFYIVKNSRDDEKVSFIKPKSVNYFRIVLPGIDL